VFCAYRLTTYTGLTYRLVRVQSDPKVIVFVKNDPDRRTVLVIRIENIGRDIAHDVKFSSSRSIPAKAFGMDIESSRVAEPMTGGPLVEGIPALGPGDSREITWGQYGGLTKSLGSDAITLNYSYCAGRRKFSGTTKLDASSYKGTDASEGPAESVARSMKDLASYSGRILSHR
jgi:hypothetical protein